MHSTTMTRPIVRLMGSTRLPLLGVALGAVLPLAVATTAPAQAQDTQAAASSPSSTTATAPAPSGPAIDGPPRPVPPAVQTTSADGRVTVRAVRVPEGVVIDGRLSDEIYAQIPSIEGFIQQEPVSGDPATEASEVWVLFDDDNLYVAARLWDSQPDRIVANEMRRDHWNISRGDSLTVALDTFYDRRNGFIFQTNPLGALRDAQVTSERDENGDWNTVWNVRTAWFEGGWTAEMAIPFKSLRYQDRTDQLWGINVQRNVSWKNERSFLSPVPASVSFGAINRFSSAATLVGIQTPASAKNIELKPYGISTTTTDRTEDISNEVDGDIGFDAKYGVTRGLTADFTVNTDFAQVEADDQQVNLTRFSLFFPEKREFFLEGQGVFNFGGRENRIWGPGGDTPIIFHSRRIGIGENGEEPIRAGGRMTGRAGAFTLGMLNMQTAETQAGLTPGTNFSVVRVRRDILRRSTIGLIGTHRSIALGGVGSNQSYGADASFAFFENLQIDTYYAMTNTPERSGDDESYRTRVENDGDRYGFEYEHLAVGENFNPEIGFVRRRDFTLNRGELKFSPRPTFTNKVRKFNYSAGIDYFENGAGQVETREFEGRFRTELQDGDDFNVEYSNTYEFLDRPFWIGNGVIIPVGEYDFQRVGGSYQFGPQRRVSGWTSVGYGSFYGGTRTEASIRSRAEITPQLSVEPEISMDWVDLPGGAFTSALAGTRLTYTASPRMFVGAFVQYSSTDSALSTNIRFRWEYQPGSDIFVVYSEGRESHLDPREVSGLQNRGFAIKMTRLFRF
ncbi:MAG: hypothetical protein CL476_00205 [Acidobacteria bacterium]|nr:hypothetical protein [Acidobacteriota bacterium]